MTRASRTATPATPATPASTDSAAPMDDPLLEGLTEPQRAAVSHVDGPLLVLAGPGSGKTRVITRRVAYLVQAIGIPPWNVLAITFTNKAAAELRERVAELVSERQARAITVATFHSLCVRIIRQYADRLNLPPGFSIYDSGDQQRAVKQALSDLAIDAKNFPPGSMLSTISNAKNELMDAEAFAQQAADFYSRTVAKVYHKYAEILTRNNALDFDDLLLRTVQLFRNHPDALRQLQERYQYVLIDEYQDTNHAQFIIASALADGHKNICATGDPDQSIYGWRGANIQNILDFETHYPTAQVVRLEQNYRSTQTILAAADALIQGNRARKHKTLWTENDVGEPVRVVTCQDERHEAEHVVQQFRQLHEQQGVPYGEMAVFYRINSLSRVIEDAMRNAGIPYQIARGTAFYDRKEIKDAVAYLRVIANPADEVNLFRVINTPARGISTNTVKALQAHSLARNTAMDELLREPMQIGSLNSRAQNSVAKFASMLEAWRTVAGFNDRPGTTLLPHRDDDDDGGDGGGGGGSGGGGEPSLRGLVQRVLEDCGLETFYANDKSDPDRERLANLGELITYAQQFEDDYLHELSVDDALGHAGTSLHDKLLAFLEQISLVADVDAVDSTQGAVTLMTLHAAKGLEYHAVAMVGVEDGILPHQRARESISEHEEERRLCFVGITRAMRTLILTHTRYRTIFGQTMPTIPSSFLDELPAETVEREDVTGQGYVHDDDAGDDQRREAQQHAGEFPPGSLVRHASFGVGRVLDITASGSHTRARVQFNTVGIKTLILQYAHLDRLS
ncbi:MAG: UvrD-helicase domain-containing protein [Phycisphaeraceae bacterium]